MHSSDVSEVQFVPVGMDDTVEEVRQRVAELPSFAGRVVTLHAEGVLLETGPFSATGIEDGGAVQVQTTHVDEDTTLEEQFLEACKELDKDEPDMTLLVQQFSALERRWVSSKRAQTETKMVHFWCFTGEDEECDEEEEEEEDLPWEPPFGPALQEAGLDVCYVDVKYEASEENHLYYYYRCKPQDQDSDASEDVPPTGFDVQKCCWPEKAGLSEKLKTLLLNNMTLSRGDFKGLNTSNNECGSITAFVFWPRRWRAKHIRCDDSFPLLEEACKGVFDPKDLGCPDIVALQEVCAASVVAWTPSLRATMLECVSQPSMPGPVAAAFLTDHFTLSTISEAEVASLERLLQRDTPAINTAFLKLVEFSSGMEKAGCAADVLLRWAKKGVNTALLKRCVDGVATSRAVCSRGSKTHPPKNKLVTPFIITILRLLLHLDMKAEMEKVVDQIQKNSKKYRVVPVAEAALALMDDAATVEVSARLVKIAQSRLKRKDVLKTVLKEHLALEGVVLMRFIACCVDAEEGKALLKKVASCTDSVPRCAAVLNGALTALKGVPALGVAPVCFLAGMCQEWVWSCLANVIDDASKCDEALNHHSYSEKKSSAVVFVTATTLLQHLGGGAPAVQQLLDTPLFTSLTQERDEDGQDWDAIQDLTDAFPKTWDTAVLDVIYSRCIDRLHKTCPVLKNVKTWRLDDTLSAPCCYNCREVCRFFASDYAKDKTMEGCDVLHEGHVSKSVLALPGQGHTFKAEVLSSPSEKYRGMLQICKVPCGQATDQELQQYQEDEENYVHMQKLIEQLEARKRALPKEETPIGTEHDPDAEVAVQDSPGEPPLKRRRVDTAMSTITPGNEVSSNCHLNPKIASNVVPNEEDTVSITSESSCWSTSNESSDHSTYSGTSESYTWAILDPSGDGRPVKKWAHRVRRKVDVSVDDCSSNTS